MTTTNFKSTKKCPKINIVIDYHDMLLVQESTPTSRAV